MYLTRYNVNAPYETAEYEYNNLVFQYESGLLYEQPETPYGGVTSTAYTTLNDELNRLANGGYGYPSYQLYKDQAGAAQKWAALLDIDLGKVTDLVGTLNYIYGITVRKDMLDLAGVCNALAGTQKLEPAAALRQVES